jgi:hypothetical protein
MGRWAWLGDDHSVQIGKAGSYERSIALGSPALTEPSHRDRAHATYDDNGRSNLPPLVAVAHTGNDSNREMLLTRVRAGGVFAWALGTPWNAEKYLSVEVVAVYATANGSVLQFMAEAVRGGTLVIPIRPKFPLSKAADVQAGAEKRSIENVLLLV